MKDWSTKIGEVLEVVKEAENECDPSAVAITRYNSLCSHIVGYIGRHISKVVFLFLSLPGSPAYATVSGMRVRDEVQLMKSCRLSFADLLWSCGLDLADLLRSCGLGLADLLWSCRLGLGYAELDFSGN